METGARQALGRVVSSMAILLSFCCHGAYTGCVRKADIRVGRHLEARSGPEAYV